MRTLSHDCVASPGAVWSLLGSLQWFDLLVRSKLSVYDAVYDFVRLDPKWSRIPVPPHVSSEILCSAVLGLFWSVDMSAPYLPMFATSDASTSFGFGGAVAACSVDEVRALSRLDERVGDYVGLGDPLLASPTRLGERHRLPSSTHDFKTSFSIKAERTEHINVMEAHASILMLKWVLRSRKRFGYRVVFGLDSKVWLGAIAKGRSSSPALAPLCRRMAALLLASGTIPHYVFIYSQENPSDGPSRGQAIAKL